MITDFILTYPRISAVIFSFVATLFVTIVTYFVTDKDKMKEIKEKQKYLREEMKKHKGNPDKIMELNKQMFEHFPEQMKQSFKPLLITMIPLLFLFWWLRGTYATTALGNWWLAYYIGGSLVFSTILRKLFKLQ